MLPSPAPEFPGAAHRPKDYTMSVVARDYLYSTAEWVLGLTAVVLPFIAIPVMFA